jgi:hypothetical protein
MESFLENEHLGIKVNETEESILKINDGYLT